MTLLGLNIKENAFINSIRINEKQDIYINSNNKMDNIPKNFNLDEIADVVGIKNEWDKGYKGKGITIAVIDSGVFPHPDLTKPNNRIIAFKDFVNGIDNPYDDSGHGTMTTGIISGNGYINSRFKGMAPESNIVAVKVLDKYGEGSINTIIKGIEWVIDNKEKYKIKIINISCGIKTEKPYETDRLSVIAEKARKSGIIVISSVGNGGFHKNSIISPAINPKVLAVGAVEVIHDRLIESYTVSDFSSRGTTKDGINKPNLVAPGTNILSLNTNVAYDAFERNNCNFYAVGNGTSMAASVISGISAVLMEHYPNRSIDQIEELLLKSCIKLDDDFIAQGSGMIRLKK